MMRGRLRRATDISVSGSASVRMGTSRRASHCPITSGGAAPSAEYTIALAVATLVAVSASWSGEGSTPLVGRAPVSNQTTAGEQFQRSGISLWRDLIHHVALAPNDAPPPGAGRTCRRNVANASTMLSTWLAVMS